MRWSGEGLEEWYLSCRVFKLDYPRWVCVAFTCPGSTHFRCFGFALENGARYLMDLRAGPARREMCGSFTVGSKRSPYNILIDDRCDDRHEEQTCRLRSARISPYVHRGNQTSLLSSRRHPIVVGEQHSHRVQAGVRNSVGGWA